MKQQDLFDDATGSQPRRRDLSDAEVMDLLSRPLFEMDYDPRWCRPLEGRRVEVIVDRRFT